MSDYRVNVVLDSLAPCGKRLTTLEATYPRFIHAEIMTHRDRARNSASSRAIPWSKIRDMVVTSPVVPIEWGAAQKGMQMGEALSPEDQIKATAIWLAARDNAVKSAEALGELGVHKALVNRLLEPWMWITVVMSATEWSNFFRLRCHSDAEIHFQKIAKMMRSALQENAPQPVSNHYWHTPYIQPDEYATLALETRLKVSVARCARVSYLTQNGVRDIADDLQLFERLVNGSGFGHWSPHEHVAEATTVKNLKSGPFIGWRQYRKRFPQENAETIEGSY